MGAAYTKVSAKEHATVQYRFQDVCLVYYLIYLTIIKTIHPCVVINNEILNF